MKYLVVGAGRMAKAVVSYLIKDLTTTKIVVTDVREQPLDEILDLCKPDPRVVTVKVNVQDYEAFKGHEDFEGLNVCIATCGYKHYEAWTDICIKAGMGMVDLGGNRDVVKAQFGMHKEALNAGVTIIPDCGLAPGMINIVGMHAYRKLADLKCTNIELKMRVGGLPVKVDYGNPLGYELVWSADGLINEYLMPSEEIYKGSIMHPPALGDLETLVGPDGLTYEAFSTGGGSSNLPTLLRNKVETVNYKTIRYPGHCHQMQAFKFLGLFEGEMRPLLTRALETKLEMRAYNEDKVVCVVECSGINPDGSLMSLRYGMVTTGRYGMLTAMAKTTGYSAAIVAKMIAFGEVTMKGTCMGELAIPGQLYLKALKDVGMDFTYGTGQK